MQNMEHDHNNADLFVGEISKWHGKIAAERAIAALQKNRFDARFFDSRIEATQAFAELIKKGMTVAFGGSQTARQLDLQKVAEQAGAIILDHNAPGLSSDEKIEVMRKQLTCDLFISSSNAISLQGELFNIDGHGNRVAALSFGPVKVVVVAGVNKLVADEDAAWQRLRSIAAPMNFQRLNRPNPCVKTGTCMNCNLPTRGCNIYTAIRRRPSLTDFSVFLINETLGF